MSMIGGNPSIQMLGLVSIFQAMENHFMAFEALEGYVLAYAEAAYQYLVQQVTMIFMSSGVEYHEAVNTYHWLDQKHPSFIWLTFSYNTSCETAYMCMSVDEEAIRK